MKEVVENFKKKSKTEKALVVIMLISTILLIGFSLSPLLYIQ
jgi:hypothetical protein